MGNGNPFPTPLLLLLPWKEQMRRMRMPILLSLAKNNGLRKRPRLWRKSMWIRSPVSGMSFGIISSVGTLLKHQRMLLPSLPRKKKRKQPPTSPRDQKSTPKKCNTSTSAATLSKTESNAAIAPAPAPSPNSASKCATPSVTTPSPSSPQNAPSGAVSPKNYYGSSPVLQMPMNSQKRIYTFGTAMAHANFSIVGASNIGRRGIWGRCMGFNGGILGRSIKTCMLIIKGRGWISWRIVLRK
mmetsp:Transcript_7506/g.12102  ORF Transcript_7506/g.12102 Transcript_7506/m.12102 type:complete len:241 (-) Transcript_7506:567-1289(-)